MVTHTKELPATPALESTARAGAVLVSASGRPALHAVPLVDGTAAIGRGDAPLDDDSLSRHHLEVACRGGRWTVTDHASRNGTFANGQRVAASAAVDAPGVVRAGAALLLLRDDVRAFEPGRVAVDDAGVRGPTLSRALDRVQRAASGDDGVLLTGESGSGKEIAARAFHAAVGGPFVAVNCAAIPEGVAERLLFGAVRGAYSGASDATGYLESADGGVLFLDEVGELDPAVQAKLLRVLETREVVPLGASRGRTVSVRFCFATLRNLRGAVHDGRFRPDLYYRVARTVVAMPSLRERAEDIPWLIDWELGRIDPALSAHPKLVEACLLRPWPGNVRELLSAVRGAADLAREQGSAIVRASHLPDEAGSATGQPAAEVPSPGSVRPEDVATAALAAAIEAHRGNLTHAARALGLHRSQIYRLIKERGLPVRA